MFLCRYISLSLSRFQNHLPLRFCRLLGKKPDPMSHLSTLPENQTNRPEKMSKLDGVEHRTLKINGINMHVAEKPGSGSGSGEDPIILFIHGFPELWYTWRHQMAALSSLGYRTIAPDLRGYGDTEAPEKVEDYTYLNVVGDLVALIDSLTGGNKAVFVVGHDWGAMIAWQLCQYRPEKVKALVNMSVLFSPRNPDRVPVPTLRHFFGDDYYICRFQKPGEVEAEFKKLGTENVLKEFLTYKTPGPIYLPKGQYFKRSENAAFALPPWLTQEDLDYYVTKYDNKGFTGPINYYRNIDRNWKLTAPWTGAKIHVPVKFIVGDQDLTYNAPGAKEYINGGGFKRDVPLLDETVVLKGLGHFLHEENPDVINQHIHSFFHKFLQTHKLIRDNTLGQKTEIGVKTNSQLDKATNSVNNQKPTIEKPNVSPAIHLLCNNGNNVCAVQMAKRESSRSSPLTLYNQFAPLGAHDKIASCRVMIV